MVSPMMRRATPDEQRAFQRVAAIGLTLPGVTLETKYDGSPVLRVGGCFCAGIATHPSAEPGSIVVRSELEDRAWLLDDAPEIYYLTDYYRPYPTVLARLACIDDDALHDLLSVSQRLTAEKVAHRGGARRVRKA
jgi:hypothetical protein